MTPYEQTDALLSEQVKPKDGGFFSLPEVDGYKYDPMALPAGSMPEDDQVVGYDEFGFKIRKNTAGNTYTIQPVKQKEDISLSERAGNVAENVGSAYQAVKEDPLGTATGLAKGLAQGVAKTVSAFSDPSATTQDALNVAGMLTLGASAATAPAGALRTGAARTKSGPQSRQKVPTYLGGGGKQDSPYSTFGTKKLKDIFDTDSYNNADPNRLPPSEDSGWVSSAKTEDGYKLDELGYTTGLDMHQLAYIKAGYTSVEDAIDQVGWDATPEAVNYINSRLQRLEENPEFKKYVSFIEVDPYFDPYVKQSFDPTFAGDTVFRSAIPEVAETIDFPKKGLDGYQLIAELQKNPSLRKAELDTVLEEIDPKARYSKQEALNLIANNVWNVSVAKENKFSGYQRQNELTDPEIDYSELVISARRPNSFVANSQHFDSSALAHTRASVREDVANGGEYLLIEELQSDLLQKGFKPTSKAIPKKTPSDAVDSFFKDLPEDSGLDENDKELLKIFAEDRRVEFFDRSRYEDFIRKVGPEKFYSEETLSSLRSATRQKTNDSSVESLLGLPNEAVPDTPDFDLVLNTVFDSESFYPSETLIELYAKAKHPDDPDAVMDYKDAIVDIYHGKVADQVIPYDIDAVSAPPVKKIEETVRMTMDALIAEAASKGVTRIVMPPFERILNARFPKDRNPDGYQKALDPKSGFYKTYVTSFQKALKEYEDEFGTGNFSYRLKDLNYRNPDELNTTGTEIDFTGLYNAGYDFSRPRFAEGGLVEDEQMNELLQEGGMADDGMSQEPTTGNDIPPGALASEVRDDVDAKLSEGEYVVPADVVRYFGVSFFEGLRTKAKEGLSEMEANGRIGGTPVDAQGVPVEDDMDELSPEEEQMLQQAMGMAEGGDVGGFDRTKFTLTPTAPSGLGGSSNVEARQYFNPSTGEKQTVQFMDGVALGSIPAGFVPWSQTLEDTYNEGKAKPKKSSSSNETSAPTTSGNNSSGATFDYSKWADENYDAINSNPYEFGMNALDDKSGQGLSKGLGIAGLATGILPLALFGAGLGASNKMQNIAEANAALLVMDSKNQQDTPQYQALTKKVASYISDLPLAQQALVKNDLAATGVNFGKAIEAKSGVAKTPAVAPTGQAPTKNGTSAPKLPVSTSVAPPRSNSGDAEAASRASANAATGASKVVNTPSGTQRVSVPTSAPAQPTTKVVSTPSGPKTVTVAKPVASQASRNGFEDGGLVTKPKKTNPKATGLGGKQ